MIGKCWQTVSAFLIWLLIFAIYFSPVLAKGYLIAPNDALTYFLPNFFRPVEAWDPLVLCGFDWRADPQMQFWYPANLLHVLGPLGWNLKMMLPHVAAAALTFGLMYSITSSRLAACVSAVSFSMSGALIGNIRHVPTMHTICWLPLAIWAFFELRNGYSFAWFSAAVVAFALMASAGFPQTLASASILSAAFAICMACRFHGYRPSVRWRCLVACLAAITIGIGISAVQLLPTAELVTMTKERLSLGRNFYDAFRFEPVNMILFLFPCLAGIGKATIYGYDYIGPFNLPSASCYAGILPLLLSAVAATENAKRKVALFFLIAGAVTLLLAMGSFTAVGWLAYYVPAYGIFRSPAKHLLELMFCLAVLAGLGTSALEKKAVPAPAFRGILIGALIVFAGALLYATSILPKLATYVTFSGAGHAGAQVLTNPAIWIPILIFFADAAAICWFALQPNSKLSQGMLVGVLFVDLASFGQFCEWSTQPFDPQRLQIPAYAQRFKDALLQSGQRALSDRGNGGSDIELPCNLASAWGIPMVGAYEALMPTRTRQFFSIAEGGFVSDKDISLPSDHCLDLGAVRYLIVPKQDAILKAASRQPDRFCKVQDLPTASVYENRRSLPRAFLVPCIMRLPDGQALGVIHHGLFDPRAIALLASQTKAGTEVEALEIKKGSPSPRQAAASQKAPTESSAKITSLTALTMQVRTNSARGQLLVTSDAFYPGWQASLDGHDVPIYRVDYMFRGVPVPAGEHIVEFKYEPWVWKVGAMLSFFFFLSWPTVYILLRKQRCFDTDAD